MRREITKKLSVSTLILQTVLSLLMVFGMHGAALADVSSQNDNQTGASTHFNVNSYLTTTGQKQTYLNSGNPISSFIIQVVNFLVLTIGSVSFLALVIGGFVLLTSHGNENQLTKGKDIIKFALIGLVVALSAYIITAFVQSIFYEIPGKT